MNGARYGASTIINVANFGLKPNTGENAVHIVRDCIEALAEVDGPCVFEFPYGQYDFFPCDIAKERYYISNTTTEEENPDITKMVGLLFKRNKNLIVEGNGSLFMFHGKMTMFTLDNCENIDIRNVNTDFIRPTVSEMTIEAIGNNYLDVRAHPDSWYIIEDQKLFWVGEGWKFDDGPAQELDPKKNIVWRVPSPVSSAIKVEEITPFLLRLYYHHVPETKIGHVYQMRDGIRDQVGAFIVNSRNITFDHVRLHYMHGLGIVGQFSENLLFNKLDLSPRAEKKRTVAAFADFMHMSGIRGKIKIINSHFEGAHDDAINVHGTHLRIVEQPEPNQLVVRFMHGQTYGFDAFFPGDQIEFLRSKSLTVYAKSTVKEATLLNPREILLTLDQAASDKINPSDVVENVSWTAEVDISGNQFSRIPTRGILMTTPQKVVIKDNVFEHTYLSGILVACDAESWYESGRINNLKIIRNKFIDCGLCGDPVIYINPENKEYHVDYPVHNNIWIEKNEFTIQSNTVLYAKSTDNLHFSSNLIEGSSINLDEKDDPIMRLLASSGIKIMGNKWNKTNKNLYLYFMPKDELTCSVDQRLQVMVQE